ncbi:hypothetical protein [Natrinema salsiterrestre]|uniref:DUF5518 domain-containing protein n=1 Tax=Natrinema salsiterrestre TaxID=2950540 RepID=A0A9Q4KZ34_9EURY|nr:hypothetical protein [Natrinema salsiterrestre]MDF9744382.1 hypothetical protein [Natrinema salsiterrestre]
MSDHEVIDVDARTLSTDALDTWILLGATVAGVLVNLNALMVPLLTRIGGGVVAGFIGAYAARRVTSGIVHAVIASALVGAVAGTITAFLGALLGLYNEPPLLVFSSIGPISPMLSGLGLPSVLLIVLAFSLLTAVDGLVGGVVGSVLRALRPW